MSLAPGLDLHFLLSLLPPATSCSLSHGSVVPLSIVGLPGVELN